MGNKYRYETEGCLSKSAWHKWEKAGAVFSLENPDANFECAADSFARRVSDYSKGNLYSTAYKAFLKGTGRADKLTLIER